MNHKRTVLTGISQLLTLEGAAKKSGRHPTASDLGVIEKASVVVDSGTIAWVGKSADLPERYRADKAMDLEGRIVLPALAECHTHLVFAGARQQEFGRRCAGATYQEIAAQGGGVLTTLAATRLAGKEELLQLATQHVDAYVQRGTGLLEIKSGYGLTLESELRILETIAELQSKFPISIVSTFMPAHAVPPEFKGKTSDFVQEMCATWIPEIAERKFSRFFDVFLEQGYFNREQTQTLVERAKECGFEIKLHADQFTDSDGARLATELKATSVDHLEKISPAGIQTLGNSETVAVLAPGASLFTSVPYPPARALIDAGARVALTTDFNPGTCPSKNLLLMTTLACCQMKLTVPEAIVAITLNAAAALGVAPSDYAIRAGNPARLASFEAPSFESLPYSFGEDLGAQLV